MPSGFNTETLTKLMVGPAILNVGGVPWGVSRGSIRWEEASVIRNPPFDGKVADIAGLDRIVSFVVRVTGSFLELGATNLQRIMQGQAPTVAGTVSTTVPVNAQVFLTSGAYLTNLQFDIQLADGNVIRIEMPKAHVTYAIGGGAADDEAMLDLAFESRQVP